MKIITSCLDNEFRNRLLSNARHLLQLATIDLEVYDVYQFLGANEQEIGSIADQLFNDCQVSQQITKHPMQFRYQSVVGQYNERAEMIEKMLHELLRLTNVKVHHSILIKVNGLNDEQYQVYKNYLLNPIEYVEIPLDYEPQPLQPSVLTDLEAIPGFIEFTEEELQTLSQNFSMELDDFIYVQNYFKQQQRNPNTTELKVIDTYWSDHCRHTTFETYLEEVKFEDGFFAELFEAALANYQSKKAAVNRDHRPMTLMELATIQARYMQAKGLATDVIISEEVNACAVDLQVNTSQGTEEWVLYFKNETHNHPTEIEPFGGASTCLGGAIRDPLSGRSYSYQAMRISGGQDAAMPIAATLEGKLPQATISQRALEGFADYGNQIGIAQSYAKEFYHEGFLAKRLEAGAILAAAPSDYIIRETPQPGDQIILLGGRTGKDGLGAAVGSSMVQDIDSLEAQGAEVQKGNPSVERQIVRLFRNQAATTLIKKCNDFGAGGVAVAVGELAEGLDINLDQVKVKYEGMHGGEIALAESQERMAVVVAPEHVPEFLKYAAEENVEAAIVATVNDSKRLTMTWNGRKIFDIKRSFLDSNGAEKYAKVFGLNPKSELPETPFEDMFEYVQRPNHRLQKSMGEQMDGTIGGQTVLNPYGGKYQMTPELGMVSKLPALQTNTVSAMASGFDPHLMSYSPFHGGYFAVIDSIAKIAAMGLDYQTIRLSLQEYFERLEADPIKWGKPFLALLGANEVMSALQLPAIGGKDSMSGSWEDLTVPPTLISFAVAHGKLEGVISRGFKKSGSKILLIENALDEHHVLDLTQFQQTMEQIYAYRQKILAASTVTMTGVIKELIEMSYGNRIGFAIDQQELTTPMMGSFLLEVAADFDEAVFDRVQVIGRTVDEQMIINDTTYDIEAVQTAALKPFEHVFYQEDLVPLELPQTTGQGTTPHFKINKALIPVLPGTNSEYDYERYFNNQGVEVITQVFQTDNMAASLVEFKNNLQEVDLLVIPHGASYGNEPDSPAKAWEIILTRADVAPVINQFVKDNYIFATGTGLDALLRTGLIEYGTVKPGSTYRLMQNPRQKFIANVLMSRGIHLGKVSSYQAPVASKWLGVEVGNDFETLMDAGQILSLFEVGYPHQSVDGIQDPTGHVFGFVSNLERLSENTLINVITNQPLLNFFNRE